MVVSLRIYIIIRIKRGNFVESFNTPKISTVTRKTKEAPEKRVEIKPVVTITPAAIESATPAEVPAVPQSSGMGIPPVEVPTVQEKNSNIPPADLQPVELPEKNDAVANNKD